jgi:hypothetical protein
MESAGGIDMGQLIALASPCDVAMVIVVRAGLLLMVVVV